MSVFTYILKRLGPKKRPKPLAATQQPSALSWKRPPKVSRPQKRPLWRFQRTTLHRYPVAAPFLFFFKRRPKVRIKRMWRLLKSIRQKQYPLPVVQPSSLSWKKPQRYVHAQRRPLWRFQRVTLHRYPYYTAPPPQVVTWKRRSPLRVLRKLRLIRSIRQKTLPYPIAQPVSIVLQRTWRVYRTR